MPETESGESRAPECADVGVGTDEATVLSVSSREPVSAPESDDEVPTFLDTDESDVDLLGDDRFSAISSSEGDFDVEDLCWDHFGVLDYSFDGGMRASSACSSVDSSVSEQAGASSCITSQLVCLRAGSETAMSRSQDGE